MQITLPYGKTGLTCELPEAAILESNIGRLKSDKDGRTLVAEAMQKPIGSKTLEELAVGKKTAVVLISDHTRPVPSRDILPLMLCALRKGNPDIDVTLLVATGCHRGTMPDELRTKLGDEICDREKIVVHDAFNAGSNVEIGILPSGAHLVIDKLAAEADLLVAEGFIEPHFFAGFSGGRKSVLPGICDRVTVYGNHCGRFIASDKARTGILDGNPIHRDMIAGAKMAKLAFIVNVIVDDAHKTVAAFAGDAEKAHLVGTEFLRRFCEIDPVPGDIVITTNGGAPLDQNLYQCVKALTAAEASINPNGTIILCAEMADGVGGEGFYRAMCESESPAALYDQYTATPQDKTIADQWQTQVLCRVLKKHRVIFVTRKQMQKPITDMKMEYAESVEQALKMAGKGKITVIPNGITVIVRQKKISVQKTNSVCAAISM